MNITHCSPYRTITTSYKGSTNTRGSRIVATSDGVRTSVGYDHALDIEGNHDAAAAALVAKLGWGGDWVSGPVPQGRVYVRLVSRAPIEE